MTGATYRQLDYWCRHGYVTPAEAAAGSGTRRVWTMADVARVRDVLAASRARADGSLAHLIAS